MKIYNDITEIFGNTPLVKINKIMDGAAANVGQSLSFITHLQLLKIALRLPWLMPLKKVVN